MVVVVVLASSGAAAAGVAALCIAKVGVGPTGGKLAVPWGGALPGTSLALYLVRRHQKKIWPLSGGLGYLATAYRGN